MANNAAATSVVVLDRGNNTTCTINLHEDQIYEETTKMRLTEHMIIARSKESDLGSIRRINLWGCDLTDITIVTKMTNIEILALSVNNLSCLQPLEACTKLQELYLRKNNIQDFQQLLHLRKLPSLTNLWLAENPCCARAGSNYRACVLSMLPNLKKLDDEVVTAEDIEKANKLNFSDHEDSEGSPSTPKDVPTKPDGFGVEQPYEPLSQSFCLSTQADPEHSVSDYSLNKSNTYEQPESLQSHPVVYKEDYIKYDEAPRSNIDQPNVENLQSPNRYETDLSQNTLQSMSNVRCSLPPTATARSDGGTVMQFKNQPTDTSRSHSINHFSSQTLNSIQQTTQPDIAEFATPRSHQMDQSIPFQSAQTQQCLPQAYSLQVQQHQQQYSSMQQTSSSSCPTGKSTLNWTQKETMPQMQTSNLNSRTTALPKAIRLPAVSHLDISQATELDLALKIPRSYSMQTISEHTEWEDRRRSLTAYHQRYPNMEAAHSYGRENVNVGITGGNVSVRESETENWDDGLVTSRTRTLEPNQTNREVSRQDSTRTNRSRSSQVFQQRDTYAEDGNQSARTRFSHVQNEDFDGDDDLRSYRTGTTLSSRNIKRRNMHLLSALLCIIPELDLESLQVLEHNIVCRMDELSSTYN